jgi:hypothetical protein
MFRFSDGHKFAFVAFNGVPLAREFEGELELSSGRFCTKRCPCELDSEWQGWLGSIATETLSDSELFLGAFMCSDQPSVDDHENKLLNRRVVLLQLGLSLVTPIFMRTKPYRVIGAQEQGRRVVRTCGSLPMIYATPGCNLNEFSVTEQVVRLGAELADSLAIVLLTQSYPRLRRAVESFLEGLRAPSISTRLHQFIRSIEGFMLPAIKGTAKDVANKSRIFLEDHYNTDLKLIYQIRSDLEHLHDPLQKLPKVSQTARLLRLAELTYMAEGLARHLVIRSLSCQTVLAMFVDDQSLRAFWDNPNESIWGGKFDIAAHLRSFDHSWAGRDLDSSEVFL